MAGKLCLNQYFARSCAASGASGDLDDGLGQPLGSPKIRTEESLVRIENDYQGHVGEIMSLGNHLGSYQDSRLTRRHAAHDLFHVAALADDIPVEACQGYPREKAHESFFDALSALSHRDRKSTRLNSS